MIKIYGRMRRKREGSTGPDSKMLDEKMKKVSTSIIRNKESALHEGSRAKNV
jgi:hypothetical protein